LRAHFQIRINNIDSLELKGEASASMSKGTG
jgi:hypothetical protein